MVLSGNVATVQWVFLHAGQGEHRQRRPAAEDCAAGRWYSLQGAQRAVLIQSHVCQKRSACLGEVQYIMLDNKLDQLKSPCLLAGMWACCPS